MVERAENASVENHEMNAAQTTTGNQRCSVPSPPDGAADGRSDDLVDRPLDNREHLFPVLGVEEVLELRALTHVLAVLTRFLFVGEI